MVAQLLEVALARSGATIRSAGTRARPGMRMPPEAQQLVALHGGTAERAEMHGATALTADLLRSAEFALAMGRDHRREMVEMDPSVTRRTFTLREFARLTADLDDDTLRTAAARGADEHARLAEILAVVASRRGLVAPPASPEDDDVVDPFGRSEATYRRSGVHVADALPAVLRVLSLAAVPLP